MQWCGAWQFNSLSVLIQGAKTSLVSNPFSSAALFMPSYNRPADTAAQAEAAASIPALSLFLLPPLAPLEQLQSVVESNRPEKFDLLAKNLKDRT